MSRQTVDTFVRVSDVGLMCIFFCFLVVQFIVLVDHDSTTRLLLCCAFLYSEFCPLVR